MSDRTALDLLDVLSPLALADAPDEAVLRQVCDRLSARMQDLAVVFCMLDDDGRPWSVIGPTAELQALVAIEFSLHEGPSVDAVRAAEPVWARCTSASDRWPNWAPAACERGIDAVVSVPVQTEQPGPPVIGSVWIALHHPEWVDDTELQTASTIAMLAIRCLARQRRLDQHRTEAAQLQQALQSRIVIEQAKGVLSARHGLPVDDAFDKMRQFARSRQRRLHDVAKQVVRDGALPSA